jgi:ATP-binding cassette, subfamily B, bacterial
MNEKVNMLKAIKIHLHAIKILHKVSPSFFPVLTLYCVLNALTPYLSIYFFANILKELSSLRRSDYLWNLLLIQTLCIGLISILKAITNRRYNTLLNDLHGRKEMLFVHKMFSMDYSELDKQENRDLKKQIWQNEQWSGWGLMRVSEIYSIILNSIIGLFSGIALTYTLFTTPVPNGNGWLNILNNPIFAFILVAIILTISILAGKLSGKSMQCWSDLASEATFGNRLFSHFGFIGRDNKRSIDIRMNKQERLINAYWKAGSVFGDNGVFAKAAKGKMGIYASIGVSITTITTGLIYLYTCLKALSGAFDISSASQYIGAATAMVSNVFALIDIIGVLKANTPYLEKTFEYLDIPNSMSIGNETLDSSNKEYEIEFKDVSFRYPASEIWALRHVNIKFKVGKRLAIVGENGSGKTTFIKLLCRLYDPQEGEILLNGVDIRNYQYKEYMSIFSVVFQDFQLISQSLGSNVAGNIDYDNEKVRKALIDAGFGERLSKLKNGLDTIIYKDLSEDGVEVSGGEAQKIAIARALYKDAPFVILDEPTAALDPIAEAEIYSKFDEIIANKTAIYISHRLSSCKFCDEIVVFDNGTIIQKGSHDELLTDINGKYYQLWHAQAQYYV